MNMSLPVGGSSGAGDAATEFTTAVYKFPQEREDMPYRVKIPGKFVTLRHVKEYMPKKGAFRYYFKTEIDSEVCFEEETDDRAQVPMFQNKMIIVQCRNDWWCGFVGENLMSIESFWTENKVESKKMS